MRKLKFIYFLTAIILTSTLTVIVKLKMDMEVFTLTMSKQYVKSQKMLEENKRLKRMLFSSEANQNEDVKKN